MLTDVHIQNFRCLKDVTVALKPLTVLIGQNDTGKSTLLDACKLLLCGNDPGVLAQDGRFRIEEIDHWRNNFAHKITIEAGTGGARLRAKPDEKTDPGWYRCQQRPGLQARVFRLPSSGPRMQCPGVKANEGVPELLEDGQNLAALLDSMLRLHRKTFFDAMEEAAVSQIPGLEEINVPTPEPDTRRVVIRLAPGFDLPADSASVGVKLIIFFLALAYHPSPPNVILIEEPENGVHPARLGEIMKLLRGITKGEHCGHAAQIILTTHSPYLLDHVELDHDQVLVFRRNDDGSRTAEAVDRDRLKLFLDDFMLGEVWFNQGEQGLVRNKEEHGAETQHPL